MGQINNAGSFFSVLWKKRSCFSNNNSQWQQDLIASLLTVSDILTISNILLFYEDWLLSYKYNSKYIWLKLTFLFQVIKSPNKGYCITSDTSYGSDGRVIQADSIQHCRKQVQSDVTQIYTFSHSSLVLCLITAHIPAMDHWSSLPYIRPAEWTYNRNSSIIFLNIVKFPASFIFVHL